jgi:hypothetical protein
VGGGVKHIWYRVKYGSGKHACKIYPVDMAGQVNSSKYLGEIKYVFQPFLYCINQRVCLYPSLLSVLSG